MLCDFFEGGILNLSPESLDDWLGELYGENFLAVYDIIIDIRNELQLSEDVKILLLPTIVKFPQLMPADGINQRDRYCDLRWKAIGVLKKRGVIRDFKLIRGTHRWDSRLGIDLDSATFEEAGKLFDAEYKDRKSKPVKESPENEAKKLAHDALEQLRSLFLRFHSVVELNRFAVVCP